VRAYDDLVIRPMTDEDRQELWQRFGGSNLGFALMSPTLGQLEAWTHVVDVRWAMPVGAGQSDDPGVERVADAVTALRLHHPGVCGTTVLWTHADPPDAPYDPFWMGHRLYAPHGAQAALFMGQHRSDIGAGDGPSLRALIDALRARRQDRLLALALRRFNSAYERYSDEDVLIDLWIGFEALLVPDGTAELRYRASLRIARLAGLNPVDRQEAFELAKRSYDTRSKVVHGVTPPSGLHATTESTRQLARRALQRWILDPPANGIAGLDRQLLA
jgi:hypothetical protein